MRQDFLNQLHALLQEKSAGGWKDGWIYGRLQQDFTLTPDEREKLAQALGFQYGWNPTVEDLLEHQWQEEKPFWERLQQPVPPEPVSPPLQPFSPKGTPPAPQSQSTQKTPRPTYTSPITPPIGQNLESTLAELTDLVGSPEH